MDHVGRKNSNITIELLETGNTYANNKSFLMRGLNPNSLSQAVLSGGETNITPSPLTKRNGTVRLVVWKRKSNESDITGRRITNRKKYLIIPIFKNAFQQIES